MKTIKNLSETDKKVINKQKIKIKKKHEKQKKVVKNVVNFLSLL